MRSSPVRSGLRSAIPRTGEKGPTPMLASTLEAAALAAPAARSTRDTARAEAERFKSWWCDGGRGATSVEKPSELCAQHDRTTKTRAATLELHEARSAWCSRKTHASSWICRAHANDSSMPRCMRGGARGPSRRTARTASGAPPFSTSCVASNLSRMRASSTVSHYTACYTRTRTGNVLSTVGDSDRV